MLSWNQYSNPAQTYSVKFRIWVNKWNIIHCIRKKSLEHVARKNKLQKKKWYIIFHREKWFLFNTQSLHPQWLKCQSLHWTSHHQAVWCTLTLDYETSISHEWKIDSISISRKPQMDDWETCSKNTHLGVGK